jgi:hypothetical protein
MRDLSQNMPRIWDYECPPQFRITPRVLACSTLMILTIGHINLPILRTLTTGLSRSAVSTFKKVIKGSAGN